MIIHYSIDSPVGYLSALLYIRSPNMSDINIDDAKELDFTDNTPNDKVDDDPLVHDPKHSDLHEENPLPTLQEEEEMIKKKYGGMLPKKPPLISKDHERAYFDSADWALARSTEGQRSTRGSSSKIGGACGQQEQCVPALMLCQGCWFDLLPPTPHQQLRSRQSTYASTDDGEVVDDNNNDAPFKDQSCKLDATNNNNANSMD
ncbi:unnamed protein product [Camellia sinensis]